MEVPAFTCIELDSSQGTNALGTVTFKTQECGSFHEFALFTGISSLPSFRQTSLTGITIPDGITVIPTSGFDTAKRLQKIVLPSSITTIGGSAFFADNISQFICFALTPPTFKSWPFSQATIHVYVPSESVQDYISAWGTGANIKSINPILV